MRFSKTFPLLLVSALAAATSSLQAQAISDTLLRTDGRRERGIEIVEATASTVKFVRGGNESSIPSTLVASISWHEPPESFQLAGAAFRRGEYTNAANLYAEAAKESGRQVLQAEAEFLAAQALVRAATNEPSTADEAVTRLKAWREKYGDGLRLPNVLLELARAQRLAGDASAAEQTLAELEDAVIRLSLEQIWTARARLEKARAMMAQDRANEARSAFRSVTNAVRSIADTAGTFEAKELAAAAVVGEGETFVGEGDFDRALRYFEGLTRDDGQPDAIRAAAWAGKGQALYLKAEAAGDAEGLREAQIALANANLLDSLSGSTTAKSLYYMGKILLALGDRETSDSKQRAVSYFETVAKDYSDTPWAIRAAGELDSD